MSYYRGDFYAGDPFFGGLFSVLGKVGSAAMGALGGLSKPSTTSLAQAVPGLGSKIMKRLPGVSTAIQRAGSMVSKHPVLSAAGAAGTIGILGGVGARTMGSPAAAGRAARLGVGGFRRRRRMRVTNPKALRRAIRRCHGFERMARRVMRFTSPRHKGRFAGFKRARKRK